MYLPPMYKQLGSFIQYNIMYNRTYTYSTTLNSTEKRSQSKWRVNRIIH